MAIESRIINGSITEIYVGGGNFITESYPTNFHTFCRQKMLSLGESVDDFREVSEKEKEAIEAKDAAFVRPPQAFIDQWNTAFVYYEWGHYVEDRGLFYGNELYFDYEEAQLVLKLSVTRNMKSYSELFRSYSSHSGVSAKCLARTYAPLISGNYNALLDYTFSGQKKLETVRICGGYWYGRDYTAPDVIAPSSTFSGCVNLRKICGNIGMRGVPESVFHGCAALEELRLHGLQGNAVFSGCPRLSKESIAYMIENRSTVGGSFTITLHPDAYARVTEEQFAAAVAKNITIAST